MIEVTDTAASRGSKYWQHDYESEAPKADRKVRTLHLHSSVCDMIDDLLAYSFLLLLWIIRRHLSNASLQVQPEAVCTVRNLFPRVCSIKPDEMNPQMRGHSELQKLYSKCFAISSLQQRQFSSQCHCSKKYRINLKVLTLTDLC